MPEQLRALDDEPLSNFLETDSWSVVSRRTGRPAQLDPAAEHMARTDRSLTKR
ncbi:hypothetical protein [Streptomyces clavifer]|uniref:hypothetical protein n=1 Tax=Streptomyces clavifer TaxID=68188 RepID=UPI003668BC0A